MIDALGLVLALVTGVLLGAIFFGGLLWTVQKGISSQQPALWFLGSFLMRTGITLVGFYLISIGNWQRLMVCLIGFIIARFVMKQLTRPSGESQTRLEQEAIHAPKS